MDIERFYDKVKQITTMWGHQFPLLPEYAERFTNEEIEEMNKLGYIDDYRYHHEMALRQEALWQ